MQQYLIKHHHHNFLMLKQIHHLISSFKQPNHQLIYVHTIICLLQNPIIIILLGLTTLNILMILKRIHTLLTVKPENSEKESDPSKKDYVERDL